MSTIHLRLYWKPLYGLSPTTTIIGNGLALHLLSSCRRKPLSSAYLKNWTPSFNGVTVKGILITEKTMRFQMSSKETIPKDWTTWKTVEWKMISEMAYFIANGLNSSLQPTKSIITIPKHATVIDYADRYAGTPKPISTRGCLRSKRIMYCNISLARNVLSSWQK